MDNASETIQNVPGSNPGRFNIFCLSQHLTAEEKNYSVQGSDQFMNWIRIDNQFNSIQHELNWNWIERFWIGIELELKAWTD